MKYFFTLIALLVFLMSYEAAYAVTNVYSGISSEIIYTVDDQHIYSGRWVNSESTIYSFDKEHICTGRFVQSKFAIYSYDNKHLYKGRWIKSNAIIYTFDDKYIYSGPTNQSKEIIYSIANKELFTGNYGNNKKVLFRFNGPISHAIAALLTINSFGIVKPAPKKAGNTIKNDFGDATGTLAVGSLVAVKAGNGSYYYACITSMNGDDCKVKDYLWKETAPAKKQDLIAVSAKGTIFKAGDKVFAVYPKDGKFYDGVINSIEKAGAYIKWNDGSRDSFVEFDKLIKK